MFLGGRFLFRIHVRRIISLSNSPHILATAHDIYVYYSGSCVTTIADYFGFSSGIIVDI